MLIEENQEQVRYNDLEQERRLRRLLPGILKGIASVLGVAQGLQDLTPALHLYQTTTQLYSLYVILKYCLKSSVE